MFQVYVLLSHADGKLYTGVTSELDRRLREHKYGKVRSTRKRRPLALIYTEVFATKLEADERERFFKTPAGGALKQRIVEELRRNPERHQLL